MRSLRYDSDGSFKTKTMYTSESTFQLVLNPDNFVSFFDLQRCYLAFLHLMYTGENV